MAVLETYGGTAARADVMLVADDFSVRSSDR